MGIEKQGSKGGNYVGGFLQMFDWNAKSRKKLFSSKSDTPEQSKQKKRCDGNLPSTRFQILDEDDFAAGSSSIKGSSDYSCASSVMDEDFGRTQAPSVVARLMGLDSLPKSNMHEPCSTPLFDSQSLHDGSYNFRRRNLEYCQDQIMHSEDVHFRKDAELKYKKVLHSPIQKFQTEILPPKSAKSIPITHHKLLSPIKSAHFIPSKDAAHIMEAAARIIEPSSGPQRSTKMKMPSVGSSSVPLRVRDLKEKVQQTQKLLESSQRKAESCAVKNVKEQPTNKMKENNKGKSISLALQAKANVQKREGLNTNCNRSQKEACEQQRSPNNQLFKSQASTSQKSTMMLKKQQQSTQQNGPTPLRQNNQKQNCIVDRGKLLPSKSTSKGGKNLTGESSSVRQRSSTKLTGPSRVSSRKFSGSEVKDDKREERITRKKRSIDGNYHSENTRASQNIRADKSAKAVHENTFVARKSSWDQDSRRTNTTDVISFTFTAPMARTGRDNCKRSLQSLDGASGSKFSFVGRNVKGGDALSTLLEQKLKELAHKVEFSQQQSRNVSDDTVMMSSTMQEENESNDDYMDIDDDKGELEVMSMSNSNVCQAGKLLDCRLPSPISVLEHSSFSESCNSADTADSNSTGGSKQWSSAQAQEALDTSYSLKIYIPIEADAELSDSASSTTTAKRWELEYVREILHNIEPMFNNYALGRTQEIISPHLFNQLESRKANYNTIIPRFNRRVLFDCVSECMELRCRQYVNGESELWAKGLSVVRRKERLADEVYREISGWSSVGDSMIDELVDKDMSSKYGKWLDFDVEVFELGMQIESRLLNSLIDEVVADMLVL